MHPSVRQAAQRKGGKWRRRKGFAANPDLARSAGSLGGKAKHANRNNSNPDKTQADTSPDQSLMEKVLRDS